MQRANKHLAPIHRKHAVFFTDVEKKFVGTTELSKNM
jgi:hypothetical protein